MAHQVKQNPSAEPRVIIRMMNLFTIEANGVVHEELMAKSRKGISLIQYLILAKHRRRAS